MCPHCGKPFTPRVSRKKGAPQTYCEPRCAVLARLARARAARAQASRPVCVECGLHPIRRYGKAYCSGVCAEAAAARQKSDYLARLRAENARRQAAMLRKWNKKCPECGGPVPPPADGRVDPRKKYCEPVCRARALHRAAKERAKTPEGRAKARRKRRAVLGRVCEVCKLDDSKTNWSQRRRFCAACDRQRGRRDALGRRKLCAECGGPRWEKRVTTNGKVVRERALNPQQGRSGLCQACWLERQDETVLERQQRLRRERDERRRKA